MLYKTIISTHDSYTTLKAYILCMSMIRYVDIYSVILRVDFVWTKC